MDAFVTKSGKRPAEEAGPSPRRPGPHLDGLTSLALCRPSPAILELETAAVEVFQTYPLDQWYDLGSGCPSASLFGPRPGSTGRRTRTSSPHPLEMFKHARAALLAEAPAFGQIPETPRVCHQPVRAHAMARAAGAPHRDKGRKPW